MPGEGIRRRTIAFCRPARTTSVTTTGTSCDLCCAHCNGHYLKAMRPADAMLEQLQSSGGPSSILVSGGCSSGGKVPMGDWPVRLKAAAAPGTRFNCHAGLVDDAEAAAVAEWADVVSFDIVGDPEVIREVYGLDRTVDDYVASYIALARRVPTVPHICIGLGREVGPPERAAMSLVHDAVDAEGITLPALVFIAFIPTRGTLFESRLAPEPAAVEEVLREARNLFPDTPIHLGCMRPGGAWRRDADVRAVRAGVDLVVQPAPEAISEARALGLTVRESDECCVFDAPPPAPAASKIRASAGTAAALGLLALACDDAPTTAYVMVGEGCARDCAFCAQARSSTARADKLSRVTWPEFDRARLTPALRAAFAAGTIRRACAQVVGTPDAVSRAADTVRFLKASTDGDVAVSVSFSASSSVEHIDALISAGADRVALPLDAANPSLYEQVKGHSMRRALDLIRACAARHPGRISTHLIAGLGETEEDILRLAADMISIGVTIGLFAFTPIPGTRMAAASPPPLDSYRRVQLGLWLLRQGSGIEVLEFSDGRLSGIASGALQLDGVGGAFQTSGCPDCNRPYYNERPGHVPYNYPRALDAAETADALKITALVGIGEVEGDE